MPISSYNMKPPKWKQPEPYGSTTPTGAYSGSSYNPSGIQSPGTLADMWAKSQGKPYGPPITPPNDNGKPIVPPPHFQGPPITAPPGTGVVPPDTGRWSGGYVNPGAVPPGPSYTPPGSVGTGTGGGASSGSGAWPGYGGNQQVPQSPFSTQSGGGPTPTSPFSTQSGGGPGSPTGGYWSGGFVNPGTTPPGPSYTPPGSVGGDTGGGPSSGSGYVPGGGGGNRQVPQSPFTTQSGGNWSGGFLNPGAVPPGPSYTPPGSVGGDTGGGPSSGSGAGPGAGGGTGQVPQTRTPAKAKVKPKPKPKAPSTGYVQTAP